jgi:hypothetical protein
MSADDSATILRWLAQPHLLTEIPKRLSFAV